MMRRNEIFLSAAMTAALSFGVTGNSQAEWVSGFEGFSVFGNTDGDVDGLVCQLCDSTVNFAVWKTEDPDGDGDWTNNPQFTGLIKPIGSGVPVDEKASYVYLYQIINTNPLGGLNPELENFNIATTAADDPDTPEDESGDPGTVVPYTSGGYLADTVDGVEVGIVFENASRSIAPSDIDTPNDGVPSRAPFTVTPFVSDGSAIIPAALQFNNLPVIASTSVRAGREQYPGALFEFAPLEPLATGARPRGTIPEEGASTLLFLTSKNPPLRYTWAESEGPGGFGAAGDVPAPGTDGEGFKWYFGKQNIPFTEDNPRLPLPIAQVELSDEFGSRISNFFFLKGLMNPARKNDGQRIGSEHLSCYSVANAFGQPPFFPPREVKIETENFGEDTVRLGSPLEVCVSAEKTFDGTTVGSINGQAYKCYNARSAQTDFPIVDLDDQFDDFDGPRELQRLSRLCTPVGKDQPAPRTDPSQFDHLACYELPRTRVRPQIEVGLRDMLIETALGQDIDFTVEFERRFCEQARRMSPLKILSGSGWKSTDTIDEDSIDNWKLVDFNDSAWSPTPATYPNPKEPGEIISGTSAEHMWHGTSTTGTDGPIEAFFRYSFDIRPEHFRLIGKAQISVDDDYELYVNGTLVFENKDGGFAEVVNTVDLTPYLQEGKNVFAIHAVDGGWDNRRNRLYERVLLDATIE